MTFQEKKEIYKKIIVSLDYCVNDYLYILDVEKNEYFISPHATTRFKMENYYFKNPLNEFKKIVYYKDYELLLSDLNKILSKEKDFHNMQYRWLNKESIPVWINCRGTVICEDNEVKYIIGCINEIGKKQYADNVSGLLGEESFKTIIYPIDDDFHTGFVLRLGIDDFKNINENYSLKFGDEVLKQTGKYIKEFLNEHQSLYRIVSDEFIILDLFGTKDDAICLYQQIQESTINFIESMNYEIYYTISAGILDFCSHPTASYTEIMKWTEFALNKAKESGKNTYNIFLDEDYQKFQRESSLIRYLHQAIDHAYEGFDVYFQPIINIKENKVENLEALLRFECSDFGKVSPQEFIPLLEKSGLIIPVGKWVLEKSIQACLALQKWASGLKVNVNISYIQVSKSAVLRDILNIIKKYNVDQNRLVIELTESGFIESDRFFVSFCNRLKENGILLALDDFGTGYSNFHYLYNLKPDCIKVDRGLMKNALANQYENMLLKHMIDMAHSVGVKMCIEGIETQEELDKILEMGCDYIQGYYFSKPLPFNEIEEYLKKKRK